MASTVYIIRHGATISAVEKRYNGHTDVPLSKEGEQQIHVLIDFFQNQIKSDPPSENPLDVVYCSDLQRSIRSAEIIARSFGLTPVIVPSMRERHFGRWEGMTVDEIQQKFPDEFSAWEKNPVQFSPTGSENTMAFRDRVLTAFYDIIDKDKNKKIAIIAHGGVNRIILCELLGIPLQNMFRITQDFSALNAVMFYEGTPILKTMNYIVKGPHLL